MSWNEHEYSVANGMPLTLYEFIRGETLHYYYTNADMAVTFNHQTWSPIAISDSGLSQGAGDNITLTLPASHPVIDLYRGVPPSGPVRVKIHRAHYRDAAEEIRTVWIGTITEIKREDAGVANIISASLASTFTREGLRLTWGRACPHAVYDHNCRLRAADYAVTGQVVTRLDGAGITVNLPAGVPDGYFSGGYIEYQVDGITERRGTRLHKENILSLFGGSAGLSVGMAVTLYPGCDLTIDTCNDKFGNVPNYGGCPHLPSVNPWQIIKVF